MLPGLIGGYLTEHPKWFIKFKMLVFFYGHLITKIAKVVIS